MKNKYYIISSPEKLGYDQRSTPGGPVAFDTLKEAREIFAKAGGHGGYSIYCVHLDKEGITTGYTRIR